jgi:hypothetical protein
MYASSMVMGTKPAALSLPMALTNSAQVLGVEAMPACLKWSLVYIKSNKKGW